MMKRDWRRHRRRLLNATGVAGLMMSYWLVGAPLSSFAAPSQGVGVHTHIKYPPSAVTDLSAAAVGSQSGDAQLAWTAPANLNGIAIKEYLIRYATYPAASLGAAKSWWNGIAASQHILSPAQAPGIQEFTTLSNLTVNVTYYFGIKSVDKDGMVSPIDSRTGTSNQAHSVPVNLTPTTPPSNPTNFTGVALSTESIQWSWTSEPTAGFYTLNDFPTGTLISQTTSTTLVETGLSTNLPYSRTVSAGNAQGLSTPVFAYTVFTLAAPPTTLSIDSVNYTAITLSWEANGNPSGTQYRLERSPDGTNFVPLTLLTSLSYQDSGLTELTTYYYRVLALNNDGIATSPSVVVSTSTPLKIDFVAPEIPMGLKGIVDPTGKAFTLSWEAVTRNADGTPLTDLDGYNIYRRTTLDGTAALITPAPIKVTAYADQVDGKTFFYSIRAIDLSGNESGDSLYADSSVDANIIFLASDQKSSVYLPQDINDLLRSGSNKYGVPLTIEMREDPIPQNTKVVRNIRLKLLRGDDKNELTDLAFSKPQAVIAVGYSLINGKVGKGAPVSQSTQTAKATGASPDQLSLYWFNGVTWVKIGGTVDLTAQAVKTKSSFMGNYQLRIAQAATSLNLEQANVYPRVFTPNNDGLNDRVYFVLENPNNVEVSGQIFDMKGRSITTLPPPESGSGIGTTLIWDGRDSNGVVVPSGVYLYRIKGEGQTFTGTVAVAR